MQDVEENYFVIYLKLMSLDDNIWTTFNEVPLLDFLLVCASWCGASVRDQQ